MTTALFRSDAARTAMERAYERCLAQAPPARAQSVATRFGATHMLVAGPEHAPPVIMIHGAMVNSAMALREVQPLLEQFRIYALDVIGVSVKSADVRVRLDARVYADWLIDVLDGLRLPKAHVSGASSGGIIARGLAERAPDRIDRLVLMVPAGIIKVPALPLMTKLMLPMLLYRTFGSRAGLARFLGATLTGSDQLIEEYLGEALKHYKIDMTVPALATPAALAGFRRPTLVIGASDDITAPGAALLARARELFPQATLELLTCKHIPPTDDVTRAKLCGLVARFLLAEDDSSRSAAG